MRPPVPDQRLAAGGWELAEETTETLFRLATVRVEGHTLLYEDATLRDALAATTHHEGPWRFFFATALAFEPSLAPGIGTALLVPTVTVEARRAFVADLEDRGFRAVERERTDRTRADSGDRVRLARYTAERDLGEVGGERRALTIEAWLGVWVHDGTFRIAGGAYPVGGLDALLADAGEERSAPSPRASREELLDLIAAVE